MKPAYLILILASLAFSWSCGSAEDKEFTIRSFYNINHTLEGIKDNTIAELKEKAMNVWEAKNHYELTQKINSSYYEVVSKAANRDRLNFDELLAEYDKFMSSIDALEEKEDIKAYLASNNSLLTLLPKITYSSKDDKEILAVRIWNEALLNTIAVANYCNYKVDHLKEVLPSSDKNLVSTNNFLDEIRVSKRYIEFSTKEFANKIEADLDTMPWLMPYYNHVERVFKIKKAYTEGNDIESYGKTREDLLDNIGPEEGDSLTGMLNDMSKYTSVTPALKAEIFKTEISILTYNIISYYFISSRDTYLDSNNVVRHRKNN